MAWSPVVILGGIALFAASEVLLGFLQILAQNLEDTYARTPRDASPGDISEWG